MFIIGAVLMAVLGTDYLTLLSGRRIYFVYWFVCCVTELASHGKIYSKGKLSDCFEIIRWKMEIL